MSSVLANLNVKISDLNFSQEDVGNLISSSKTQIKWDFKLDGEMKKIELNHSRITGKRVIFLNGVEILKTHKYTYDFSYTFFIDKHHINIIQITPESYDLKIDNILYSSIMNEERLNRVKGISSLDEPKSNNFEAIDSKKLKKASGKNNNLFGTSKSKGNNNNNNANANFFDNNFDFEDVDPNKIQTKAKIEKKDDWNFEFDDDGENNKQRKKVKDASNIDNKNTIGVNSNSNGVKNNQSNLFEFGNNNNSNKSQNTVNNSLFGNPVKTQNIPLKTEPQKQNMFDFGSGNFQNVPTQIIPQSNNITNTNLFDFGQNPNPNMNANQNNSNKFDLLTFSAQPQQANQQSIYPISTSNSNSSNLLGDFNFSANNTNSINKQTNSVVNNNDFNFGSQPKQTFPVGNTNNNFDFFGGNSMNINNNNNSFNNINFNNPTVSNNNINHNAVNFNNFQGSNQNSINNLVDFGSKPVNNPPQTDFFNIAFNPNLVNNQPSEIKKIQTGSDFEFKF